MLIEDINDALAFLRTNEIVELKGQKANNFNKQKENFMSMDIKDKTLKPAFYMFVRLLRHFSLSEESY